MWAGLLGFFLALPAAVQDSQEGGLTYRIYSGGRQVGMEKVVIETQGGVLCVRSELELSRRLQGRLVRTVYRGKLEADAKTLRPVRYQVHGSGYGDEARFLFEVDGGKIRLTGSLAGKEIPPRTVGRSPEAIFYDGLMVSHMVAVLRVLRPGPGGRTEARATVLPNLNESELIIEDRGEANLIGQGKVEGARAYFVKLESVGMIVYVGEKGRLLLFRNPFNHTRIVLDGFEKYTVAAKISPKLPEGAEEKEVRFPSGEVELAGALVKPAKAKRNGGGVVLLGGAGPVDRDGNTLDLRIDLLKVIAYRLAEAGFVVLRYDKRGVGRSEGNLAVTKLSGFVQDAEAAVERLRREEGVAPGQVSLVGHGEGGQVGMLVAARDERLRALLLLSVPADPLDRLLLRRFREEARRRRMPEEQIEAEIRRRREYFERIRSADGDWLQVHPGDRVFIGWLREHFRLEPLEAVTKVRCAIGVVQGMKDRFVPPDSAARFERALKAAEHKFEVMRFENLDHTFMESEEGDIARLAEERPVDPGFLSYLADLLRRFGLK